MNVAQSTVRVYSTSEGEEWDALISSAWRHDFYHLSGYHALAEGRGEGEALLISYREGEEWVALPLMLNSIDSLPGVKVVGIADATSVYGYPGPVTSGPSALSTLRAGFHSALDAVLSRRGVCTVFSRLHPMLGQNSLLDGLGEIVPMGTTVSIDMALDTSEQYRRYRKGHKSDIKKLKRSGAVCVGDENGEYLGRFVEIYRETMQRIGAREDYMFDHSYFERLLAIRGVSWRLVVCLRDGEVLCGALFSLCGGIVQYHLSGTAQRYSKEAPTKLLLDDIRLWAKEQNVWAFHLGGGLGSKEDSLFEFKAGFSDRRQEFAVWRWVRDPGLYVRLVADRREWLAKNEIEAVDTGFFPEHRAPLRPGSGR